MRELPWNMPRVLLGDTYAVDSSQRGGTPAPVTPYIPPMPVVYLTAPTAATQYANQRLPVTDKALTEDIYIRPKVNVSVVPATTITPTQKFVSSLPSLTPQEYSAWVEPFKLTTQAANIKATNRPQDWRSSDIGQAYTFVESLHVPAATTTRQKFDALRQAAINKVGNAGFADTLVNQAVFTAARERGVSPAQQIDLLYSAARGNVVGFAKTAIAQSVKVPDLETTGISDAIGSVSQWFKSSSAATRRDVESASAGIEKSITDLIRPVVASYAGKASILGFAAKFDKYINANVPEDASKARSWATKVYMDIIKQMFQQTPKDAMSRNISDEIKSRWTDRIRTDLAESTSTSADTDPQSIVDAAKRLREDLASMKADIAATTERHVLASTEVANPAQAWAKPHTEKEVTSPAAYDTDALKSRQKEIVNELRALSRDPEGNEAYRDQLHAEFARNEKLLKGGSKVQTPNPPAQVQKAEVAPTFDFNKAFGAGGTSRKATGGNYKPAAKQSVQSAAVEQKQSGQYIADEYVPRYTGQSATEDEAERLLRLADQYAVRYKIRVGKPLPPGTPETRQSLMWSPPGAQ